MKPKFYLKKHFFLITILGLCMSIVSPLSISAQYNFSHSNLSGVSFSASPTSLQFGPDNRLYVAQQNGLIKVFTVVRNGANSYSASKTETISLINKIPNHNDDGTVNTGVITRQITGILVKGTATNPMIYVSSSDSRIGGPSGDLNLDTNSGIISTLTWNGSAWVKMDLVRGLPRSEENHASNGMQLYHFTTSNKDILYVAQGGHTNGGSPCTNFAFTCEYALSAAILSIDVTAINGMTTKSSGYTAYKYDLPTLDDPTRSNPTTGKDINDPFGGNDGLNQAKIVSGGPVQVFAPGFRNPFDFLITKAGNMYTIDNGANQGWGGYPQYEGTSGVTNKYLTGEPGSSSPSSTEGTVNNMDNFERIGNIATYKPNSYYGGHPNPIRANPAGAGLWTQTGTTGVWRTSKSGTSPLPADWPPVPVANSIEGDFQMPGVEDKALLTFTSSTNGLTEYTASNFNNYLKGSILACSYDGYIDLIRLSSDGLTVLNSKGASRLNTDPSFATNFGTQPLDIVARGDNDVFPGTVWVNLYGTKAIAIFEPQDFGNCTGAYDNNDDDGDGYTNADEIDNNSNPCSAASVPPDYDLDHISDLNDPDDDNDGIADTQDFFALDINNGQKTTTPITYDLFNNYPGTGLFGVGFTGLMTKAGTNYSSLYNPNNLIAGGAVGAFTVEKVSAGDALGSLNTQENAFQFGVKPANSLPYSVQTRMTSPFFNSSPQASQSQGIYVGTGDQDNYLKITLTATGFKVIYEANGGVVTTEDTLVSGAATAQTVDLFLSVNPTAGTVQPKYAINKGQAFTIGAPIPVSGNLLTALHGGTSAPAYAVGIISTSGTATSFAATWDFINVLQDGTTGTEVSTYTLVDATTSQDIRTLNDGDVIDLSAIAGKSINIRANTTPSTVGSVAFELNGNPARVETGTPYSLYGDLNGTYNGWTPNVGSYTLKATPYSSGNATGIGGTPLTIKFSVVDPSAGISPITFTLVNSTTDLDIGPLNNGDVINLATISGNSINIRANSSTAVGSIVFNLTGPLVKNQTESTAPYALFGDVSGNYNNWTPALGSYTLKGTPYSASGGTGTAGTPLTIGFSVTNQAAMVQSAAKAAKEQIIPQPVLTAVKAYPNPSDKGRFTVLLPSKFEGEMTFTLMSLAGNKLISGNLSLKKPTSMLTFDFSREMVASGLYYLQLQSKDQKANVGLMRSK